MRAESHVAKEADSYVHQCANPSRIAHNAVQFVQTLVINTAKDLKKLPAIKVSFIKNRIHAEIKI